MESRIQEALDTILSYGGIGGNHHKQWVLDQVVRHLTGCPLVEKAGISFDGKEYTYMALGKNEQYNEWVERYEQEGEYEWDEGIIP